MAKIRVHELAKEIGMPSKQLVDILQAMGLNIKNHMSTMEENQVVWVKKKLQEGASATGKGKQEAQAARGEQPDSQARESQAKQQPKPAEEQRDRGPSQVQGRSEASSRPVTDNLRTPLKYSTSKSNPVLTMLVSNLPMNHIGDPSSSVLLSIPADHSHHGNRIKTYNPAVINGEDNLDAAIKPPLLEIDIRVPRPEGDKASPVTNPGGRKT